MPYLEEQDEGNPLVIGVVCFGMLFRVILSDTVVSIPVVEGRFSSWKGGSKHECDHFEVFSGCVKRGICVMDLFS